MEKEIVMSKKHYRDYTKPEVTAVATDTNTAVVSDEPVEAVKDVGSVEEPIVEEPIAKEAEAEDPVEEPIKEETVEEPEVAEPVRTLYTANTFADEYKEGVISCERLNVRKAPEKGDNVIGIFTKGTRVKIIEDLGEWVSIEVAKHGNKIRGFAMKEFIK